MSISNSACYLNYLDNTSSDSRLLNAGGSARADSDYASLRASRLYWTFVYTAPLRDEPDSEPPEGGKLGSEFSRSELLDSVLRNADEKFGRMLTRLAK